MAEPKSTDITPHTGRVFREDRAKLLGHRGATVWFTGLSGSGKSTLAVGLEAALHARGYLAYRLDGDNVRFGLCRDLGFSADDRAENIRRIGEVSKLMADAGAIVLCSFVSPYRRDRDRVRVLHDEAELPFLEVHVHVPLDVAEQRDPKGLYKKARAGEIQRFTGIDDPFEPPAEGAAELVVPTHELSVEQGVQRLLGMLTERGVIGA